MIFYLEQLAECHIEAVAALEAACFSDPWSPGLVRGLLGSPYDETWVLWGEEVSTAQTDVKAADSAPYSEAGTADSKARAPRTLIGYITFRFLAGEGELMRIAVLPEYRGCGHSRKLMDCLEKTAKKQGISALTLEVRAGNEAALNLYKSYDFVAEAVRKKYYHNPEEDAVIMWRRDLLTIPT